MVDDGPLPPACMKCEQVTGKSTCFPGPCVFFHERNIEGTKASQIAQIDRVYRGARDAVRASKLAADQNLIDALVKLRRTAVLLLNNSEACAINHYGEDYQGVLPGWLTDCRSDILDATMLLQAVGGFEPKEPQS